MSGMFTFTSDTKQIKYEVLKEVARHAFRGDLETAKEQIPFDVIPGVKARFRCCVYREREIVRQRVNLASGKTPMGVPVDRSKRQVVHVIPSACEGCPINRFSVTQNCQKCMAKNCLKACPFGAISVNSSGAHIDQEKCRECGRCAKVCPYNAIADLVRPCKRACPVDAISMDENKIVTIDESKCINCLRCTVECPFGAISDDSYMVDVIDEIRAGKPVYAVFAPAIEGQFGPDVTIGMIKDILKQVGFADSVEVALGADAVSVHEAAELAERLEAGQTMTTSCCPAFYNMIAKHFPKLLPNVSGTVSPMIATARYLKAQHSDAVVVFIGPCTAKKTEILHEELRGDTDYVMTFEELCAMIDAKELQFDKDKQDADQDGSIYGKQFAASGGVTGAVMRALDEREIAAPVLANRCNGALECKKALQLLQAGKLPENFIEGMACEGGCVNGPGGYAPVDKVVRNRKKLLELSNIDNIHANFEEHSFDQIWLER